ncbi:MAG TPA: tripartite tricarboxylate transporter substrate binding protein [Burkholderiales bacterium]|nr:tripartite tricarboxylate transporter substrate binding protein [Burkholderiales bacterium]
MLRLLIALLACAVQSALAQGYPSKPIHLIVPFPPGGPTDIVGRLVAQKLSEGFGQPVVVDNRPGAGGTVGSTAAAKAAADGYTLLYGSTSTLAIAPSLYHDLAYDPRSAFAPISLVSRGAIIAAVNAQVPARTLQEFIALAKKTPGTLSYASAGSGTPPHLAAELFKSIAGVDVLHVPYKGGAPAINDLVGGQVQAIFEGQVVLLPHIKSGRVRALAITGAKRDAALPDVPTFAQAGLPQYDAYFWSGLVAPVGTPADIVGKLNAVLVRALNTAGVREALLRQGLAPAGTTPAEFAAFIGSEVERWGRVAKASGAKVE